MNKRFRRPYGKREIKRDVVLDNHETNSSLCYPHKLHKKHGFCLSPSHNRCSSKSKQKSERRVSNILFAILKSQSNWDERSKVAKHNTRFFLSILLKLTHQFKQRAGLGMLEDELLGIMCPQSTKCYCLCYFYFSQTI